MFWINFINKFIHFIFTKPSHEQLLMLHRISIHSSSLTLCSRYIHFIFTKYSRKCLYIHVYKYFTITTFCFISHYYIFHHLAHIVYEAGYLCTITHEIFSHVIHTTFTKYSRILHTFILSSHNIHVKFT